MLSTTDKMGLIELMNEMNNRVLGLDIGGTNIRAGLVSPDFTLSGFEMTSSVGLFETPGRQVEALADYVWEYCGTHTGGVPPRAVSIGFPSTLNKEKTRLLSTPNLPGFDNLEIVTLLRQKLRIPVYINRDVNLLMLNDIHQNGLSKADIIIGCYIGTGLGNAIYINGEMLSGKNGVAGELGHVPVLGGRRPCGCGNVGCMETIASGKYLEELQARYFPDDRISELFLKHPDDPVLRDYVEGLSVPVATEINLFDPDFVILGGGVLQMQGFPMGLLKKFIGQHTRKPLPYENLKIIISAQNQESGVIGAGMYAFRQMQKGNGI